MPDTPDNLTTAAYWITTVTSALVGRRIVQVRYTPHEVAENSNWAQLGIELALDNGTVIVVECDNENGGPGALSIYSRTEELIAHAPILPADVAKQTI